MIKLPTVKIIHKQTITMDFFVGKYDRKPITRKTLDMFNADISFIQNEIKNNPTNELLRCEMYLRRLTHYFK